MKIIFLDIDGPMIPNTMFLVNRMCSWERQFPETTVAVLREMCERTGAKVVFNTTHNRPIKDVPNIPEALVAAGFPENHLHPDDRNTSFPDNRRLEAIRQWLSRHPEVEDWVALDDENFGHKNLIVVDPDPGLTIAHLNAVIGRFGGKAVVIL